MYFKGNIVITDPCYLDGINKHHSIERNTIYGDWSCMVYPGTMEGNNKPNEWQEFYMKFFNDYNFEEKSDEEKRELSMNFNIFRKKWLEENNIYGEFCADSGMVCVCLYDDLNEKDKLFIKEHPRCVTVIEDFNGDVDFVVNSESNGDKHLHVVGNGNKPFFTVQTMF